MCSVIKSVVLTLSVSQLKHHVVTTLKKCGGYVKVAVTWQSRDHDFARWWQFGESGIDVVGSWPCVTL